MEPEEGVDSFQWPRTEIGALVYRAKYRRDETALEILSERLAAVATTNELFRATDYVLTVPGHKPAQESFGEVLAAQVAAKVGVPVLKTRCSLAERPEAKSGIGTTELESHLDIDRAVGGKVVLVVDDLYRSGSSLAAVAKAATRSGARGRLGLVGARTLRL